jgi:hypothetical protein
VLPVKINGLPAHILLVHVVIVLVPLAALLLVASAIWPAARAKLGFLTPAVALVALIFVPITTNAGHWLRNHLPGARTSPAITKHANLGGTLLPWVIGIFVVAAAVWVLGRWYGLTWRAAPDAARALPVGVAAVVAVAAIAVSVGAVVQLYRIGDSGSRAEWSGRVPG